MIIKKIEIENFRSYYKSNVFELVNGLNLIIGSNGDGKTTFYEALEWLFRTDGTSKADTKLISKKRSEELSADESADVRVAMTYEHKGYVKTLEKRFKTSFCISFAIIVLPLAGNPISKRSSILSLAKTTAILSCTV